MSSQSRTSRQPRPRRQPPLCAQQALHGLSASPEPITITQPAQWGTWIAGLPGPAPVEVVFQLAIGRSVAVFLLLTVAGQLLVAARGVHRWYEGTLERPAN